MALDSDRPSVVPAGAPEADPTLAWQPAPGRPAVGLLGWLLAYLLVDLAVAAVEPGGVAAPWYPPLALAIALLVRHGRTAWPVVVLADLLGSLVVGGTAVVASIADAGVVAAEAVVVVTLAGRALRQRPDGGPVLAFQLLAASAVAAVAAATIGAPVVSWLDDGTASWSEWRTWVVGDLTGIVTVLPALLLGLEWWDRRHERGLVARWRAGALETGVVIAVTLVGTGVAFGIPTEVDAHLHGLELLLAVPVVWFAVRTSPAASALLTLAVNVTAVVAVRAAAPGWLEEAGHLVTLQGFMVALAAIGLVTSFSVSAHRHADERQRTILDASPLAVIGLDRHGVVTDWSPAATTIFGWSAAEAVGRRLPLIDADDWTSFERRHADLLAGRGADGVPVAYRHRDGHRVVGRLFASRVLDASGVPVGAIGLIEDLGDRHQLVQERDRLAAAIEQAAESIVVTDPSARIVYANPAVEAATGYSLDELVGQNPRIFQSGLQTPEVYERMWATLTSGHTWRGVLVNRRKDGTLLEEDASISPVRDAHGELVAYVGVKRDLTVERELRDQLAAEVRDRAETIEALGRIRADGTLLGTSQQVVEAVRRLDGVQAAAFLWLDTDGGVRHRAVAASDELPLVSEQLPAGEAELLHARAVSLPGGWAESVEEHRRVCRDGCVLPDGVPITGLVHAPVIVAGDPVAVIGAVTTDADGGEWARRRLPALAEFANHTAALLAPLVDHHTRFEAVRTRIGAVMAERAFTPVFQPIVDAASHRTVGHEALTRFDDGMRPDLRFAEAHRVGLGDDLERACALAACDLAADLAGTGFVSVNLSPSLLDEDLLVELQRRARRPLVVELTEHVPVDDYHRVRATIEHLRPKVRLAVDDAGAGYASLRHVLELRPDIVKLDLGLVRDIDRDPARQAIAAGLVHYATITGTQLIAEGVETRDEAIELERLGVPLLQGYLWGQPAPLRPHPATPPEPEVGVEPTT